jgi:hypothetical protein
MINTFMLVAAPQTSPYLFIQHQTDLAGSAGQAPRQFLNMGDRQPPGPDKLKPAAPDCRQPREPSRDSDASIGHGSRCVIEAAIFLLAGIRLIVCTHPLRSPSAMPYLGACVLIESSGCD